MTFFGVPLERQEIAIRYPTDDDMDEQGVASGDSGSISIVRIT